jgi:hypothetical protein
LFGSLFDQLSDEEPIDIVLQRLGLHYLQVVLAPLALATYRMALHEADRSEVGHLLWNTDQPRVGPGWLISWPARRRAGNSSPTCSPSTRRGTSRHCWNRS